MDAINCPAHNRVDKCMIIPKDGDEKASWTFVICQENGAQKARATLVGPSVTINYPSAPLTFLRGASQFIFAHYLAIDQTGRKKTDTAKNRRHKWQKAEDFSRMNRRPNPNGRRKMGSRFCDPSLKLYSKKCNCQGREKRKNCKGDQKVVLDLWLSQMHFEARSPMAFGLFFLKGYISYVD